MSKQERNNTALPVFPSTVRCYPETASAAPDVFCPAAFAAVSRDRTLIWTRAVLSNHPRLIKPIRDFPSALYLWVLMWSRVPWMVFKMWTRVWSSTPGFQDPFLFLSLVLQTCLYYCWLSQRHSCYSESGGVLVFTFIGVYRCLFSLCLF